VALIALAGYAWFIGSHATIAAGGSDSSGYMNSARLLASGQIAMEIRVPPTLAAAEGLFRPDFQPLGYRATAEAPRLSPTYPTGLPLHLTLFSAVAGWTVGPMIVLILGAVGAVVLCYALGRLLGLHWVTAATGAVILAVCPLLLYTSLQPLSDTLATTWCLAAVTAAVRSRQVGGNTWAAVTGAALGMAVLVRPTNAVLAPALVVLLGFRLRPLLCATLAGLPFAAWLAAYNHFNYGSMFRSGYYPISAAFSTAVAWPTAGHFLRWLALFLPTVVLLLPFAALARREGRGRELLGLGLWFGSITGLYLFYEISQESWASLRFILPGLPALVLAGMLGLEATFRGGRESMSRAIACLVMVVWAFGGSWYWVRKNGYLYVKMYEDAYATVSLTARDQFPPGTLVVCSQFSGALYYYTDFPILRWDHVQPSDFKRYAGVAARSGVPIRAVLYDIEETSDFHARCPGQWKLIRRINNISLWELEPTTT
jgi:hypothetical protein